MTSQTHTQKAATSGLAKQPSRWGIVRSCRAYLGNLTDTFALEPMEGGLIA